MSTPGRPNFFVLLELDPNTGWNEQEYQRRFSQARQRWSRDSNGLQSLPKTGEAKRNLQLVKEITATMTVPVRREQERAAALKLRAADLVTRRNDIVDRLTLMLKRGYLLVAEATGLQEDFSDVLAQDAELARRLDQAEIRSPPSDGAESRLSARMESDLRDWLAQARASSLYDVLKNVDAKVTNSSSLPVLREAADALYRDAHSQADKSDPSVTARQRLSGLAKTIFSSDADRRRYDTSMKVAVVQRLIERFEQVLRHAASVTAAQFEFFLERVRIDGADDLDLAKESFLAYFRARGWAIEVPPAEAEAALRRKVQCPRCGELNEPEQQACVTCGLVLRNPCPACGRTAPTYGGGCACGFPIGQRYLVDDLIAQAQAAVDAHELAQAEVLLDRAARIWDLPPGKSDPVTTSIDTMRSGLVAAREELQSAQTAVQRLMSQRRYIAAADKLRSAPGSLPGRAALLDQAETAIRDAREAYNAARRPGTSRAEQAELYAEALRLCDDLEPARTELARIPPDPPADVRATVSDPAAGVLVSWRASADPDVSYLVVRRTGLVPPQTPENLPGQSCLGTVTATTWRDLGAAQLAGLPLTYAVFAGRSGTYSSACAAAPVTVMAETEVQARSEDAQVVLTWQSPPQAARIEVTRPGAGGSAAQSWTNEQVTGRLVDADVQTGVRYTYTVRTAYRGLDGELAWSEGTSVDVIPTRRPAPPGPLLVTGSRPEHGFYEHKVVIRSPAPERGVVRIVRQPGTGTLREGDQGPENEIRLDGKVLDNSRIDYWLGNESPLCSYVPVLVLDGMAYVGAARRYALAAEVSGLQAEFAGAVARVGWTWPEGCQEALVSYDSAPGLEDPTSADRQLRVSRLNGDPAGGCDIALEPDSTNLDVVVATVIQKDGLDFITSGTRTHITRPGTRVRYRVRATGRNRRELMLSATGQVELPATILRGRPGGAPLTRDDGVLVASYEAVRFTGRHALPVPKQDQPGLTHRLFTVSPAAGATVELVPD
jgi:hypothetical protein